jgi:hypothetical protein
MARLVKSIVSGSNVVGLGETTSADQLEGRYAVEIATLTDAATITPDFGANQNFTVTLGRQPHISEPDKHCGRPDRFYLLGAGRNRFAHPVF